MQDGKLHKIFVLKIAETMYCAKFRPARMCAGGAKEKPLPTWGRGRCGGDYTPMTLKNALRFSSMRSMDTPIMPRTMALTR